MFNLKHEFLMILLLIVSSTSCATPMFLRNDYNLPLVLCSFPKTVAIDKNVPINDIPVIKKSFNYWNKELGYNIFNKFIDLRTDDIPDDMHNYIFVTVRPYSDVEDTHPKRRGVMVPEVTMGCMTGSKIIYYSEVINRKSSFFEWLIKHEVGHALGIDHSDSKKYLMHYNFSANGRKIPKADRKKINALKNIYNLYKHKR